MEALCCNHYPDFPNQDWVRFGDSPLYSMQLASPSMKAELEHCYLTRSNFWFSRPRDLEDFLDQHSLYQQSLLRSITIDMGRVRYLYRNIRDWEATFARLPRNLTSIHFNARCWASRAMEGGGWLLCHDSNSMSKRVVESINILGNQARRLAARAKVGFLEWGSDQIEARDGVIWVPVLNTLEPWSKNWLEWWEEASEANLKDGESASSAT